MTDRMKSGIAFIIIAIVVFAIGYGLMRNITTQLLAVIHSLPEADPSVTILNRVVDQCEFVKSIITSLASIIFGVGVYYFRSARKSLKG